MSQLKDILMFFFVLFIAGACFLSAGFLLGLSWEYGALTLANWLAEGVQNGASD